MKVKVKANDLLEVVTLAELKNNVKENNIKGVKTIMDETLIKFNSDNKIEIGCKITEPVTMAFYFIYDIDDGEVSEEGEIAVDLGKVEKILKSFKGDDMISIYTQDSVLIFERAKPKRKVTYTPLEKKLVIGQKWESDYKFDSQELTLVRDGKQYEIAYANVNSEAIKNELDINNFTEYNKIKIIIKNGIMSMKLGDKLVFSESDMTTSVKGEIEAYYAVGFDNVFSTLAQFGGDTDMIFVLPNKILYINHDTDKFRFEALIPSTINE